MYEGDQEEIFDFERKKELRNVLKKERLEEEKINKYLIKKEERKKKSN